MKKGEGIQKWLTIVILIIIVVIFVLLVFLPILMGKVKAESDCDFIIDIQIGNQIAILNLPPRLTEFKQRRELVQVLLLEIPFISERGETMIAVRDLEKLFPTTVEWCSQNRNIKVVIPAGIISKNKLVFTLMDKDYLIRNDRAFISIRGLSKILKASEIIWIPETKGIRLIW